MSIILSSYPRWQCCVDNIGSSKLNVKRPGEYHTQAALPLGSGGRTVSRPHGSGVTLVSGEQFAGKLNDSKRSDMSHWGSVFLRAASLNSLNLFDKEWFFCT